MTASTAAAFPDLTNDDYLVLQQVERAGDDGLRIVTNEPRHHDADRLTGQAMLNRIPIYAFKQGAQTNVDAFRYQLTVLGAQALDDWRMS